MRIPTQSLARHHFPSLSTGHSRGDGIAYNEKVDYIHLNPVEAGLVKRAEDWKWSSIHDYMGSVNAALEMGCLIPVDRIVMPADERRRI